MTDKKLTRKDAYLRELDKRVLIFDGAMGTMLQLQKLTVADFGGEQYHGCNDYLALSSPQTVSGIHKVYLEAGADVVETDSFRANRLTLTDYALADKTHEINFAAAQLARKAADEYSTPEKPRFVAGSIGPSGKLISTNDPEMSTITYDELVELFREQARGLIEGGADLLLIETSNDILEVKATIHGIQLAFEDTGIWLPIQAQVTLDINGKMLLGTDITAVLSILEGMGVNVVGLNCSTGPEHMRGAISYLSEHSQLPISCIPNAGLPMNVDGEAVYPMQAEEFSTALSEYVGRYGIRVVGGCCGTTPAHILALSQKIAALSPTKNEPGAFASLASSVQAVALEQQPAPFVIGERLNAQGSRAFKRLLLTEDHDGMLQIARDQVDFGAHALDVSVAVTERSDEADMMRRLVKRLTLEVPVPLVIDTTEPDVVEVALETAPGRCLINSTNFEAGDAKPRRIFALAKQHSAAVMALTIDEEGMAKTAERKLQIARRLVELAAEYDLRPEDIVIDDLTFTLATGEEIYRDSAIQTLEGIRLIKKELPGVHTSLGVSNVSFGFSPASRKVLNSVFLYHAVQAGLDMAIVNPAQVKPYAEIPANERELAENLIFNRSDAALPDFIAYFDSVVTSEDDQAGKADPFEGLTNSERLFQKVLRRHKAGIEEDIDAILAENADQAKGVVAVMILNEVLLPAMKEVGDRFGAGDLILPFVLQSAEVMKKAVTHLENYLDKQEGLSKGKLVIATVFGDVHDIGKNLVRTILSNNGYEVVDLGKQVPMETIISAAVEQKASAIGLSALLVSTSKQMALIINELQRRGLDIPVLIGGAAINPAFGRRILKTESGEYYRGGVFYCKDAFEGLNVMDQLSDPVRKEALLATVKEKADQEFGKKKVERPVSIAEKTSNVKPATFIPEVSKWGPRVVRNLPLQTVATHLDIKSLYRMNWGGTGLKGEDWEKMQAEFDARRLRMLVEGEKEGWYKPQAVYGYWPAASEGNDLIVFDPASLGKDLRELTRFTFPRQPAGEQLCLADYFMPLDSGVMDMVALQVVTVGKQATERFEALDAAGEYSEGFFFHGLAVQLAEATADYLHKQIRRELKMSPEQGLRYSWGYPSIPELQDHGKVFELLPAEQELGMSLTSAYQLVPEQSTAAIILHHPDAQYFNVGTSLTDRAFGG
ncbi:MAG TPA: methionine synthase [Anaerolineaceae bacterium]|nr:methionine synthase [Anaerolineaceae bacterium]